jgi:hypothetical protein
MRMIAIGSLVLAFICCLGVVWFFIDAFVLADVDNVWQQVAAGTAATTLAAFALVLWPSRRSSCSRMSARKSGGSAMR